MSSTLIKHRNASYLYLDLRKGMFTGTKHGVNDKEILIENCHIATLILSEVEYKRPVIIRNCKILSLVVTYATFKGGLTIENCTIVRSLWRGSGVNVEGVILIKDNVFEKVFDVTFSTFGHPVSVSSNDFREGHTLRHISNLYRDGLDYRANKGSDVKSEMRKSPVEAIDMHLSLCFLGLFVIFAIYLGIRRYLP